MRMEAGMAARPRLRRQPQSGIHCVPRLTSCGGAGTKVGTAVAGGWVVRQLRLSGRSGRPSTWQTWRRAIQLKPSTCR